MKKDHVKEILISILVLGFWMFGFVPSALSAPGDISTVAGGGVGDGDPAISARLYAPYDVFVDGSGNIYIAEEHNHWIRKVDTSGIISIVAGDGTDGFSGDGGPATSASLDVPEGVFVDGSGNIYIVDTGNHRIRKVDTSGIITTVAGNGFHGFSGDEGPATSASLTWPEGVFVDASGNIYIADTSNQRVRKVDTSGIISTVAGDGTRGFSGDGGPATSASLNGPSGVFVDGSGSIYIADEYNDRIRKVDTSGIITTVAGNGTRAFSGDGGPATSASLDGPSGVFVDGLGNIYIADEHNHRIRKVDTSDIISTVAGDGTRGFSGDGGPATSARLSSPLAVFMDGLGNIYIADGGNHRIRKVDTSGIISTVPRDGIAGFSGDGGPATDASFFTPRGVFVDGSGNIYIADMNNGRIRKVDTSGIISTVAGNGTFGFSGDGGPATDASLNFPSDVSVDGSGLIYIVDRYNHRIRKVDTSGIISTVAGSGATGFDAGGFSGDGGPATDASLFNPLGVSVDGSGVIYIADTNNHRIRKVDASGIISTVAGNGELGFSGDGGPATSGSLFNPLGVSVDGSGVIYIADANNYRIRKVDTSGVISTVAGNGSGGGFSGDGGPATDASLYRPYDVFVDGSGVIYIVDWLNHRIRKVDTSGIISTVAGDGSRGFSGDGGPATSARLSSPQSVFVDGSGNIYIGDQGNHRIRKVEGILVGDFDGDNEVGLSDFVRFLDVFGATTDPANSVFDLDNDGEIGLSDFVIFLDNFGRVG